MFEKNLESFENISLKRRLSKISPIESRVGISYCVTPSNDYILLKDDVPLDDLTNPRKAAKEALTHAIKGELKSSDTIILFGIGLGYLLDETFNNYPSRIYLYEPDINLLHFVLSNVDISEHLASGRVYITSDMDDLIARLNSTYLTKDRVEIVYLKNYAILKNKELLQLTQKVLDTCKSKIVDINTITKFSKRWVTNTVHNIGASLERPVYLLSDLENKFIGQTALVVAAGPSLTDNIEKIKSNREAYVIFAVNKVVRDLMQNGIIPDFVVCLDAKNMSKTLGGLEEHLQKTCCIMDIRADYALMSMPFRKTFINFSDTDFFMQKYAKFGNDLKFYESGGSASTLALITAARLGFSKIICVGLDLAFKDNTIYSTGETMTRISQEQILVDAVKKNLVKVKSINGNYVYTREDYATFVKHFETIIKELNHHEIYNVSTFGAYIEGMKNKPLEEITGFMPVSLSAVAFVQPYKFEMKELMQEEFNQINNIITLLSKGNFSPPLISAIIKSVMVYQYMQAEVLQVLQRNLDPSCAEEFLERTKATIKYLVEILQKNKLI